MSVMYCESHGRLYDSDFSDCPACENTPASILSEEPDGVGFYYGQEPGGHRQINIRPVFANDNDLDLLWEIFVGGLIVGTASTKDAAELKALLWCSANPEPVDG